MQSANCEQNRKLGRVPVLSAKRDDILSTCLRPISTKFGKAMRIRAPPPKKKENVTERIFENFPFRGRLLPKPQYLKGVDRCIPTSTPLGMRQKDARKRQSPQAGHDEIFARDNHREWAFVGGLTTSPTNSRGRRAAIMNFVKC